MELLTDILLVRTKVVQGMKPRDRNTEAHVRKKRKMKRDCECYVGNNCGHQHLPGISAQKLHTST